MGYTRTMSETDPPNPLTTRRNLLIIGGALGIMATWQSLSPALRDLFAGDFTFTDLPGLAPFRKIADATVSTAISDPFFGLGATPSRDFALTGPLEAHLFANSPPDALPVAVFSDYNCPYCKVISAHVAALFEQGAIAPTYHELAQLGESSLIGARAALAAERQGAYQPMHGRLIRAPFRLTEDYVRKIAGELSLDINRLVTDMDSDPVSRDIARAKALARRFGILGTPSMIIGRTLVIGQISPPRLKRLVALETA